MSRHGSPIRRPTRDTYSVCLLGLAVVQGAFHEVSGWPRFDPVHPAESATGVARIGAASIDCGDPDLDAAHRGPDLLDADRYPDILLEARSILAQGRGRFRMIADVTIRSVTRSVAFDIDYGGVRTEGRGGRRATMTMTGSVDCADFGLTRSMILRRMAGTGVALTIDVELVEELGAVATQSTSRRSCRARASAADRLRTSSLA